MDGGQFHYPQCCHATLDQMQRIRKAELRTSEQVGKFLNSILNLLGLLIDLLEESKAKGSFIIVSVNFTFMFTSSTQHRAILRFRNNIS